MTQPQIDEARAALTELTADEQELNTLATQRGEEISSLKATGSKDFAALAALEGQRAALQTMLTEQRGHVAAAQARITALEAEQARAASRAQLEAQAVTLKACRGETDALFSELHTFLVSHLLRITASRSRWAAELSQAQQTAAQLYGLRPLAGLNHNQAGIWSGPLAELGDEISQALTQSPYVYPHAQGILTSPYRPPTHGETETGLAELARKPIINYFDRPISLTVAAALTAAAQAAPHAMKSVDAQYATATVPVREGGPAGYL